MGILHLRALDRFAVNHYMEVSISLVFNGLHYCRVAVAYVAYGYATYKVDIGFALGIPKRGAFGFYYM
jgi:hypothetical protein